MSRTIEAKVKTRVKIRVCRRKVALDYRMTGMADGQRNLQ